MTDQTKTNDNISNINNIGLLPLNFDSMNGNQLLNNTIQINNYNNPQYITSNLNINNYLYYNQNNYNPNNNPMNQIQNYNQNQANEKVDQNSKNQNYPYIINYNTNINNHNNFYNNINTNCYQQSSINFKTTKPYFTAKHSLLKSSSLEEVNEKIFKDLLMLEKFLPNYKNYIVNNNFEAINICLKYIEVTHFFFNNVVTQKIGDIINNIIFSKNQDEEFKYRLKDLFKKMIPYNIREKYLKEFYSPYSEKNLYNLFKKDLNLSKNYKEYRDNIYYLYQIYEIINYKLNNKDRLEIKNIFNKYSYLINNTNNINNNYNDKNTETYLSNNKFRKHSFQSSNNNWNYNSYENNGYISNNRNYINDKNNNDELSYKKSYDNNHYISPYPRKNNNYKGSYSSRHYYSDNNKLKNKGIRKHSAYDGGAVLVEVRTTPKKEEDNEEDKPDNINIENIKEEIKDINKIKDDINIDNKDKQKEKAEEKEEEEEQKVDIEDKNNYINLENKVEKNDLKEMNAIKEEKKEEADIKEKGKVIKIINNENNVEIVKKVEDNLINELNISLEKEEPKESKDDNLESNEILNINVIDSSEKEEDKEDNMKEDILISDFNSLNPFNEKKTSEKDNSEKEESSNNLGIVHQEPNIFLDGNDGANNLVLHILNNNTENDLNNINLFDNILGNDELHNEQNENNDYIQINQINNDNNTEDIKEKEDLIHINSYNNINKEINEKEDEKEIKSDYNNLNISPKNEIMYSNSENNINEKINLQKNLGENNIMNINQNNLTSISDNNIINLNKNLYNQQNNINNNSNININNNDNFNIPNDQIQMLRYLSQNNNNNILYNINPFLLQNLQNIPKANINNNILNINTNNINDISMNLMSNINSGINLLNLINMQNNFVNSNNMTGIYYQNNNSQYYITILLNYLNEQHNLLSALKPYSKANKNNHYSVQSNIEYIKQKNDKLSLEYNNKLKKIKENNPLLIKERLNLFEEKIILPIYNKICEENQQRKDIYTEVYNKYRDIINKILQNNKLEETKVEPYGSIVNNFMTEYGDIDICINPKDNNTICDYDIILEQIKEEIVDKQGLAKYIILEKYSKFLILKLKDIETEIDLDITVQNILPIINTKLIRFYSLLDQRFHIFGIFLKFWVKKNHIHGALDKYLSSYALLILIIHYLQTIVEPKILPILQQVRNIKEEYKYHNEVKELITNLYFEEDINEIKKYMKIINSESENDMSVVELIIGFFEYYAYKYDHYWISISRSDKIPVDDNEMAAFPLEDPFDINYNPGKSMRLNTLQYSAFIYCMKKELNNILSGEYFKYAIVE